MWARLCFKEFHLPTKCASDDGNISIFTVIQLFMNVSYNKLQGIFFFKALKCSIAFISSKNLTKFE